MPPFTSADPNAYIALGIQSALGTPQSTPAKFRFAKYLAGNGFQVQPAVVDIREGGDGLDFGTSYKTGIEVSGQIVCYPRPEFLGQALALIPGGATWDGATAAPVGHRFHTNHASHPFATLQIAHPGTDLVHLFSDVRFTGLTFAMRSGQPHQLTMPFRAINVGASSGIALVPSYSTEEFFMYHHSPSYVLDGVADSTIDSVTLSIALGVEALQAQSIELDDIVVQNRDITFEFTRRYQNSALWKKIMYAGGVEATSAVATGALNLYNVIGAGAALRSIEIMAGLLSYRSNQLTELNPDGQTVKETVAGKVLKTASAALAIAIKSNHASAYAS